MASAAAQTAPSSSSSSGEHLDSTDSHTESSDGSSVAEGFARISKLNADANYDVVIVGGGVTGSALLYELTAFTDLKKIALFERRSDFANVASGPNNNSQTIHCGDIETNYTLEKAQSVKRYADMMRNYATKLPESERSHCIQKMSKMALGVGDEECAFIEKRFATFREVFPNMHLVGSSQIRELEPCVVRETTHRDRPERVNAIYIPDEYTAVDYYHLTHSFIKNARTEAQDKNVDVRLQTEVREIKRDEDGTFELSVASFGNPQSSVRARFVVVSACGYSLLMAQRMGYGLQFSCLPMAGSFYFSARPFLNGKVYTVQNPLLPFAAVHGDPDIVAHGKTRFGPTALPLPLLERYNNRSFPDFLEVLRLDMRLCRIYFDLFSNSTLRNYVLRNLLFEVPVLNKKLFLKDVRKICPGMQEEHLEYAHGFGGVRPQLVDKKQLKLLLGEGKIQGDHIIFNVTPSPGGTTCLGNGEADMRKIVETIGGNIDEEKFRAALLEGEYPV